ncbi:enoyl-CoA hydratase [Thelephora ganbajun]|uniref:Enoyl-CoA hydratase n=1 Tax=Thelephora ganbajun TaxID=370292 RepID=A0ACB6Z9Z4_THEGA|nr:enoyl-CoA hydratase [Thelephora ganbajun]
MFRIIRLRSCRFSSRTHVSKRAYNVSASSDVEAFLKPAGSSNPGVTYLSLNRPKTKNAISVNLLQQFRDCLEQVRFDKDTRVLIVNSTSDNAFCSGADLIERKSMTQPQVNKFLVDLRSAFSALEGLPFPTIAAIDGPALGGGLEMALSCDLRVAGFAATKIGLTETKLGIIPGAGGTQRLTRLIGVPKAKDLIFTAQALTAHQALDYGVIDYVSEEGKTGLDRALQLAREISLNGPLAVRAAKQAISRAMEFPLEAGLDFERASYEPLLRSKDRIEALEAFKAKRPPQFKGE